MFTSKITSILNYNNNIKLILSDICDYTVSDRIFVLNGDLSNSSNTRDPFDDNNNGYKILNIFNNEITLDKTYSSLFLSSVNSYISNICVNESYIIGDARNTVFIKDCIINNTNIGTIFVSDINTLDISINMWHGYVSNSFINTGNIGNWYNNKAIVGNNLVVIENSQVGKGSSFNNVYINKCNTTDCTFGYITFNNGIHNAVSNKVVVDHAIINNGIFNDMVFNYVNMINGTISGTGSLISSIAYDNPTTPTVINITLDANDNRITLNSDTMLINYGNYINDFNNYTKNVIINDYSLNSLNISAIAATIDVNYLNTWKTPVSPSILSNSGSYLTISNIKSGNISGGYINKTIIGNDTTKTNVSNATLLNSCIKNSIVSNVLIDTDNINIPVRFKDSIINSYLFSNSIPYVPFENCVINTELYKSEINNSVINTNINLCNVLNSFMLDGNYTNTYSEDLKVKNINYISGTVPDFLNYGHNLMNPNTIFNTKTTTATISYNTNPLITLNLVELIDSSSNYITPDVDDYLQIKIYNGANEYYTYLKVTTAIRNDIIDLNTAAFNSSPRPVKTVQYNWINYDFVTIDNPVSVDISLYSFFVPVYPNNLTVDLGFLGTANTLITVMPGGNLDTRLGPFTPVLVITSDIPNANSLLGSAVKISSTDITYNENAPFPIFNSTYPPGYEEILPNVNKSYISINNMQTYYSIINLSGSPILNVTNGVNGLGDPYTLDINVSLEYKSNTIDPYTSYNIMKTIVLI